MSKKKTPLEEFKIVHAIQGNHGNWNYDNYMHGMYNGMELALAIMEERDPIFKTAPEQWINEATGVLSDDPSRAKTEPKTEASQNQPRKDGQYE